MREEASFGRVETGSAPGRGDRSGPALGEPAQAVAGAAAGPVPGHGGLRPGFPPRRDRGRAARLRRRRGAGGPGRTARRRCRLPAVAAVVRPASGRPGLRGGQGRSTAACRWPATWPSWSGWPGGWTRAGIAVHARVRPAVLPGDACGSKELLATTLGPPRLILGQSRLFGFDRYAVPGPTTQIAPAPLLIDPGSYLLDWCCVPLPGAARSRSAGRGAMVVPTGKGAAPSPDFESFVAGFPAGALAQIALRPLSPRSAGERPAGSCPPRDSRSSPSAGPPGSRCPSGSSGGTRRGTHEERLPLEPTVGDVLNDQFHRLVRKGQSLAPTIRDALEIARLVQDLRQSQDDGIVVDAGRPAELTKDRPTMGRTPALPRDSTTRQPPPVWLLLVAAAAVVGLVPALDAIRQSSATYDEVAYLRVAARWWRTGEQAEITRMGSPLTFWKLQQAPVLWVLDRLGRRSADRRPDPAPGRAAAARPRRGALDLAGRAWGSVPGGAGGSTAPGRWPWPPGSSPSARTCSPTAALVTMELPLLACTTGMLLLFWTFLDERPPALVLGVGGAGRPGVLVQVHGRAHPADPGRRLVGRRPAAGPGRRGLCGHGPGRRGDGRLCRRHAGWRIS